MHVKAPSINESFSRGGSGVAVRHTARFLFPPSGYWGYVYLHDSREAVRAVLLVGVDVSGTLLREVRGDGLCLVNEQDESGTAQNRLGERSRLADQHIVNA
ncbi:MAG: hypothetical protein DCC68_13690 [Planctomycetota bacterium]|nr:MAG: hypothetical protein DCC68_13690 [Planctomycetota bacterium]